MTGSLTFKAIDEAQPGAKWKSRWDWSWPAYEAWFRGRGGDEGPTRSACEAALRRYMPELVEVHARLTQLAGGGERAARFLSGWCPPPYLGGCSLAAQSREGEVRLVRNYDLSPDLNEGLLLRSAWTGRPVMGMVEFLWGLSDGVNEAGFCVALAYGGRGTVAPGFGITTIVRYLLETCDTVEEAVSRLQTLPSHMAYNLVMADADGRVASLELCPGGGVRRMPSAVATNHQHGPEQADRAAFTRTQERRSHLDALLAAGIGPDLLRDQFLASPLFQRNYRGGFGTLFTADYDPARRTMTLLWPGQSWCQRLESFQEGVRTIAFEDQMRKPEPVLPMPHAEQAAPGSVDWAAFGLAIGRRFSSFHAGMHDNAANMRTQFDQWHDAPCPASRCGWTFADP